MKISVVCFQKNRHAELEAAEGEYLKRLVARARVEVHPIARWKSLTTSIPTMPPPIR